MNFEEVIQQLKDAMTVTAATSLRQEERLKEHDKRLEADERSIQHHRDWLMEHKAAMRDLDRKLALLTDLIPKGRSGNGQN